MGPHESARANVSRDFEQLASAGLSGGPPSHVLEGIGFMSLYPHVMCATDNVTIEKEQSWKAHKDMSTPSFLIHLSGPSLTQSCIPAPYVTRLIRYYAQENPNPFQNV
jgi:hypothetical protein